MKFLKAALLGLALATVPFFASACASAGVCISPSTTPITENDTYSTLGKTEGNAWGTIIWFFPVMDPNPSKTATDNAIKKGGADALIETTEEFHMYAFPFFTVLHTKVVGTGVKVTYGGAR